MNTQQWLGRWFGSPSRSGRLKSRPRTRRTLLQVEHLETRCVPTLFTSLGSLTGGGATGTGSDPNGILVEDAGGNLYGTAEGGGSNNDGTVFEVPYLGGNVYGPITALASFNGVDGIMPLGGLLEDASGDLFGVTATGTIATHPSGGTIFVIPAHTNTISTLAVFNGNNGQNPVCSLIMDASGDLFGTTVSGGSLNEGTVFELPRFSSTIITLTSFHGPDGANPYGGVIMDSSGNLYGTTSAGGPLNDGTVYELPFSGGMYGPVTILGAFNGTNGSTPTQYARPMLDSQGNLWGTASMGGGGPNVGTVWELPKGLGTIAYYPFTSNTNGAIPEAGVVEDVNTNVIGTCTAGGTGMGTVFELGSEGTGSFTSLVNFTGTGGAVPGSAPQSTLIQDSMGDLFGSTTTGGSANDGTVFELIPTCSPIGTVVPNGTVGQTNYNFTIQATDVIGTASFSLASGTALPPGLTLNAAGLVSGTPTMSGTFHATVVVTDSDGNSGSATYTFVINPPVTITTPSLPSWTVYQPGYGQMINAIGGTGLLTLATTSGVLPPGLTLTSNGLLAGTPTSTGSYTFTVTATDTVGASASQNYTVVINPPVSVGVTALVSFAGANGATPAGDLLKINNDIFGTTSSGGPPSTSGPSLGTVFEYQESTGTLMTLAAFTGPNGAEPGGGLVADPNGNLYGTTVAGGASGNGAFFEIPYNPTTGMYQPLMLCASFNGTSNGGNPYGTLAMDSSGNFYGTTSAGGANGLGTVFELMQTSPDVWSIVTLASFDGTHGAVPLAGVTLMNRNVYGTTSQGGTSGEGTVFLVPFTTAGSYGPLTTIASFNDTNGSDPQAALTADANGDLFGTTLAGGTNEAGTVFEVPNGSGSIDTLVSFDITHGAYPVGDLTLDSNGNLFGTTAFGGPSSDGGVFECKKFTSPASPSAAIWLASFNGPNGANPSAGVIEHCDGNLFGTTFAGGAAGGGTVFKVINTLPAGFKGEAYEGTIEASGGTGVLTFTAPYGLPPGLALSNDGMLTGMPTSPGTFVITIQVTDADGASDTHLYTLPVYLPLQIVNSTLPVAEVGCPYSQPIQTTGGSAPLTFLIVAGGLPPGLTLNNSGLIAGTPTAAGSYTFTVTVTDGAGDSATQTYTLIVNPMVMITIPSLPGGTVGFFYSQTINTAGGIPPIAFGTTAGSLPSGLNLNSSTGVISGVPQTPGTYTFTVTATDGGGCSASETYTVVIAPAASLVLTKSHSGNFHQGDAADVYTIIVTNVGTGPTLGPVIVTDPLPSGLAPTAADTGTINGWTLMTSAQTVTATRSDPLAGGSSYPALPITVSVAASAPASVVNVASLSWAGIAYTATDFTVIQPLAGPAVKAAFALQPTKTPTGVVLSAVSVQILDASGNVVTTDSTDSVIMTVASGPGLFTPESTTTATLHNGVATFSNLSLVVPGSYTLSAVLPTLGLITYSSIFGVVPLQVFAGSFVGTPSGFSAQFNAPFLIDSMTPVLYGQGPVPPSPSVIVTTDPGNLGDTAAYVEGSLVVTASNSITFVATNTASEVNNGTPQLPDGTYTVILRSSALTNGFQAAKKGGFLDGLYTGIPGSGDYVNTFTVNVAASHQDVLWVPPTADGPGQPLEAPGMNQAGGGYPIYLSDSTGTVSMVQVTVNYNPALLTVTGASGAGFSLLASSMPGRAVLQYSGPALPKGTQTVVGYLNATVPPGTALTPTPYKAKDLLHLSGVALNGGSTAVATSDALHLVAYVGDADGDGRYTGNDAVLITRVTLQTDSGFAAYPLVDPVIVADLDGVGFIPADAALQVNEAGVGYPTSNLPSPPIPSGVVFQAIGNNVDPSVSIPASLLVGASGVLTVPVNIDDAHPTGSTGLIEGHVALTYDPRQFTVSAADVHLGSVLGAGNGWRLTPTIDQATGQMAIAFSSDTPITSTAGGSLVTIDFHPIAGWIASPSTIALAPSASPNGKYATTELEDAQGTFTLTPSPATGTFVGNRGIVEITTMAPAALLDAPASAGAVRTDSHAIAGTEALAFTSAAVVPEPAQEEAPVEPPAPVTTGSGTVRPNDAESLGGDVLSQRPSPAGAPAVRSTVLGVAPSAGVTWGTVPLATMVFQIASNAAVNGPFAAGLLVGPGATDQFFQTLGGVFSQVVGAANPLLMQSSGRHGDDLIGDPAGSAFWRVFLETREPASGSTQEEGGDRQPALSESRAVQSALHDYFAEADGSFDFEATEE
jgi:uncharacterized repeat protein (TIGR03803 family)